MWGLLTSEIGCEYASWIWHPIRGSSGAGLLGISGSRPAPNQRQANSPANGRAKSLCETLTRNTRSFHSPRGDSASVDQRSASFRTYTFIDPPHVTEGSKADVCRSNRMSALPPKADIVHHGANVRSRAPVWFEKFENYCDVAGVIKANTAVRVAHICFGPKADIASPVRAAHGAPKQVWHSPPHRTTTP